MQPPDPVLLAIFAIDRDGPAAVRACASGVEVRVTAPDEATAAVFRAALAETARRRGTDRLMRSSSIDASGVADVAQARPSRASAVL